MRFRFNKRLTVNILLLVGILVIYLNIDEKKHEKWPVIYQNITIGNPLAFFQLANQDNEAKTLAKKLKLNILDLSAQINVSNKTCNFNSSIIIPQPLQISNISNIDSAEAILTKKGVQIKPGGRYAPKKCQARFKVAIIIPYRNRTAMLATFMKHMHEFLIPQNIDYGFYLVEPVGNITFNRGLLLNIGFLESLRITKDHWDCFIFHDIDLLPEDGRNFYSCPLRDKPRHMSSLFLMENLGKRLPYYGIFGGVSALSKEQMVKVNGYSNMYFGWGGEDDDMHERIINNCYTVARYPLGIGRYLMINHLKDPNPNPLRYLFLENGHRIMNKDGLNSIEYELVKKVDQKLYTHLFVYYDRIKILSNKYNITLLDEIIKNDTEAKLREKQKNISTTLNKNSPGYLLKKMSLCYIVINMLIIKT